MSAQSQIGGTLGVLFAVSLGGFKEAVSAQPAELDLVITVRLYNYAEVPKITLRQARKETAEIFRKAGVNVMWLEAPLADNKRHSGSREPHGSEGSVLKVAILSRAMAQRVNSSESEFGRSWRQARLAVVFYYRIDELAQALRSPSYQSAVEARSWLETNQARILGRLMAHELGHLLLPFNSHSANGVMKGDWDHHERRALVTGDVHFTREQAELIRERLSWGTIDSATRGNRIFDQLEP